jgi:hypothetical protein
VSLFFRNKIRSSLFTSSASSKKPEDHPCTVPHARFFGWLLTDDEVACVLSYIRNAWGNSTPAVNAGTVGKARKKLQECSD